MIFIDIYQQKKGKKKGRKASKSWKGPKTWGGKNGMMMLE